MSPDVGQTVETGIAALDKATGAKHVLSRTYFQWDTLVKNGALSADVTQAIAAGRTPVISVKSAENGGTVVKWGTIANGSRDADITKMADALKATNKPILFTFMHEPEDQLKDGWGTAAEYRGAWQRIVTKFRDAGATNVSFALILTGYAYDTGSADQYYPGDSYIDWIGTDPYAWNSCGGNSKTFPTFTTIMQKTVDFANAHDKPVLVAEYGVHASTSADKTKKAAWFVDARAAAKKLPAIKALIYFNHDNHGGSDCMWSFSKDAAITSAYAAMATDPYFAKNPLTEKDSSSTTMVPAPTGVTTTAGDASIAVAWKAVTGAKTYSIKYAKGSDAASYSTGITSTTAMFSGLTNGAAYTISVRAILADGTKSDFSTAVTATPTKPQVFGAPTGVKATAGNKAITVSWGAVTGAKSYSIQYQKGTSAPVWVTGVTTRSQSITGLTNGASYSISVRAIATDGTKSAYSATVTASPKA